MRTSSHSATRPAPGPRGGWLLGNAREVLRDPQGFFLRTMTEFGGIAAVDYGLAKAFVITDAALAHRVLVEQHRNYPKSRNYRAIKLVLGQGLLTSEGELWRRQRRLAQPSFHRERLASFLRVMTESTADLLAEWSARPAGQAFDIHRDMNRLTLRVASRSLFGVDLDEEADALGQALSFSLKYANDIIDKPYLPPPWVPTPRNVHFRRALKTFDQVVYKMIEDRRRRGAPGDDLLGTLMEAKDEETGEAMSQRQLRDELLTLILAGHETTANTMAWAFYLLSKHPSVARQVEEEVQRVLGDRAPELADLPQLTTVGQVISETLRLYPPVWVFERQNIETDVLDGVEIPPGSIITIVPYALHRNPSYWPNPEGFDPERFSPERAKDHPRHAYLPFATGPRNCIGSGFALMEASVILAMIAQRHRLSLVPGRAVVEEALMTLRPKHGVWVTATASRPASALRLAPAAALPEAAAVCPFAPPAAAR